MVCVCVILYMHMILTSICLLENGNVVGSSDGSERKALLRSYSHAFRGFSAMLTENEASLLSGNINIRSSSSSSSFFWINFHLCSFNINEKHIDHEEVISVFPDPKLQLHTTRSWDFLRLPDSKLTAKRHHHHHHKHKSSDVIIGVIDTGVDFIHYNFT